MVADFNARQIGDIEAMLAWLGHQRLELAALWPDRPAPECFHVSERNAICSWLFACDGKADLYISSNEVSPEHFGSYCRAKSTDIPTPHWEPK